MRLKRGESAKTFDVTDIFGKNISIKDFVGKKLMISFFRYASCPLCNLRIYQLIQHYPKFHEKGLEILAFFQSPKKNILEYVGKQNIPFSIIADPKRKIYSIYGVETSVKGWLKGLKRSSEFSEAAKLGFFGGKTKGKKTLIPADFLIGPDQRIEIAYYGKDIGDHIAFKEIEDFIKKK